MPKEVILPLMEPMVLADYRPIISGIVRHAAPIPWDQFKAICKPDAYLHGVPHHLRLGPMRLAETIRDEIY